MPATTCIPELSPVKVAVQDKEIAEEQPFFLYSGDPRLDPPVWRFQGITVLELTGQSAEVLTDPAHWYQIVHPEDRPSLLKARHRLVAGRPICTQYRILDRQGGERLVEDRAVPLRASEGTVIEVQGLIIDMTAAKAEEEALRERERHYRELVENQGEGAVIVDEEENFLFANPAAEQIYGVPPGGLVGCNVRQFTQPEQFATVERQTGQRRLGEKSKYELQITRLSGEQRVVRVTATPHFDVQGNYIGSFGVFVDITDRKGEEEERNRLASFLQMAPIPIIEMGSNGAILFANGVAHQLFPDLEEKGLQHPFLSGLSSAFAIMEQQRLETFVREVTVDHAIFQQALYATPWARASGTTGGSQRSLHIYALDMTDRQQTEQALRVSEQRYRILVERSLAGVFRTTRDGRILECNDAFAQILGFRSRQEILSHSAQVSYMNPQHRDQLVRRLTLEGSLTNVEQQVRRRDGKEIWILENASLIVGERGAMITIQGTVIDITQRKISQQLLEESLVRLSQRLEQTVQALATLAEMKDPYTAGHQTHVAQLAGAIGREMKLDGEALECLRVAATLHDLGKLYVPAEILSKPGKLNAIEFRLIQTHPQVGYEILKGIDFPWPVAEIVLQHHERMDGSGYPRAMKGDVVLLEARIIAAADVVEAMSYHRPYRPALGVEKALEEIRSHRGALFDEDVVAACLRIFEKGEFRFQN